MSTPNKPGNDDKPLSFLETLQSVAASLFGVQSRENRQRDFARGRPLQFIVVGLIGVAVFIGVLVIIVKLLLRSAGL